jgi:benzoyl-CoA reductase/2-hydroxyglutaryl-CoA dehydratase subunit BcrC/BadD/HgdB
MCARRLEALETIRAEVLARPAQIKAERAKGRKVVGWLNYNLPEELLHALGVIPVHLGWGGDDHLVDVGARYISTKNCVFVRQTVGEFAEKTNPFIQELDLLAVEATCMQLFRVAELVKYYFKVETLVLGVPRNFATPEGLTYFKAELKHFTERLESWAGTKLEPKKLQDSVALYAEGRALVRELYDFQAVRKPAITWRETVEAVQAGNFLDRERHNALLRQLIAELNAVEGPARIAEDYDSVRLFLSGSLIPPGDHKLLDIIEANGGRVVGDDLWSSLIAALDLEVKEASVDGLAEAYLARVPHGALPYLDLDSDRRVANLKGLIKHFRAHAVIYHTLRYCDPYTFKANETKEVLKKEGVPFLEIHTEYAGSDYEAIRTRIEAFVELLRNKNALVGV